MFFAISSERVVLPDAVRPATVVVRDGRIAGIEEHGKGPVGVALQDVGGRVLMPGLVDTHVHINDPGRADWEGFEHATRAAAAGGVTTLVDMPLNSIPPTTTVRGLEAKRGAARGRCWVDVMFWGGVVPGNAKDLELLARAGVRGFKCFLSPSGVDEFENVGEADLREAMPVLASLRLPLLAHAEWPGLLHEAAPLDRSTPIDPRNHATWLAMRPDASEVAAIELLGRLAVEFGARVHIVHLSSAEGLSAIHRARQAGALLTVETCPHYLTFAHEEIDAGATAFKCAPPLRSRANREELWSALADGTIDFIATDHSPAPPALKRMDAGNFLEAWGGIASLQLGLAAVWSGACERGIGIDRVAAWLSSGPARLAGVSDWKGTIAVGRDADLVVWDPDVEWTVDAAALEHRHAVTPYDRRRLRGRIVTTMRRGVVVFDNGKVRGEPGGTIG